MNQICESLLKFRRKRNMQTHLSWAKLNEILWAEEKAVREETDGVQNTTNE